MVVSLSFRLNWKLSMCQFDYPVFQCMELDMEEKEKLMLFSLSLSHHNPMASYK
jgi:hypothetical protein